MQEIGQADALRFLSISSRDIASNGQNIQVGIGEDNIASLASYISPE